ncbi:MAG: ABC transporter ATP-binding protein [Methylococcaceae bacterium]|nr:ABC transporter ATP-binding protein [Methylococcaceae bacterium]
MTTLIEAEHLTRYYGRHCAVNDVSFTLSKGEVLGFLGPNGAGKTTTMQMLCGNLAPSSGQIKINGFDMLDEPKLAKGNLGYLPDTPPLYKELTVQEFLHYCAQLHGMSSKLSAQAIARVKERCGLTEVGDRLIINLSKGFQQRLGIAQAILHSPEVIVLDEPTVGLDPIQIREIRALIRELGQDHGVLLSTHILTEVQESCSHVQIIHEGQLVLNETIAGLNRQMCTGTLLVSTRLTADSQMLIAIPGVFSIENLDKNRLRIHHDVNNSPVEQIAELIIKSGWGLQELIPIKKSIEDIFISLTKEQKHLDL